MRDWYTDFIETMVTRMQMHPGNENLIYTINQLRLAYIQGKKEGKI